MTENMKSKSLAQLHMLNELSHRLQSVLSADNVYKETLRVIQSRVNY
jgi:hypothetical protein